MLTCYTNITNIKQVFKSISSQLIQTEKHFSWLKICESNTTNHYILNDTSFEDITFDNFFGENINLIHHNAFGKSARTIKKLILLHAYLNHSPPKHDVWKLLSGLVNVERINVNLNITEIPSKAFNQTNLKAIIIHTANKIMLKKRAFYNLDNLNELHFECGINKIQTEAFAMSKSSSKQLNIAFYEFEGDIFDPDSLKGLHRSVHIKIDSNVDYVPESSFKAILDNQNNITVIPYIDCFDCRNYWLIKDGRAKQVFGANCRHDHSITLFHPENEYLFNEYCIYNHSSTLFRPQNFSYHNKSYIKYVSNQTHSTLSSNYLIISSIIIFYLHFSIMNRSLRANNIQSK